MQRGDLATMKYAFTFALHKLNFIFFSILFIQLLCNTMKMSVRTLTIFFFTLASASLATQLRVEQHDSAEGMIALALGFAFFSGLITFYGWNISASNRRRPSLASSRKALTFLNFVCLLAICSAMAWVIGGVLAFSQTNFFAFSVLLYFLGLRLGAYLQFHY